MKKVLPIGGSGHIGSMLTHELLGRGSAITQNEKLVELRHREVEVHLSLLDKALEECGGTCGLWNRSSTTLIEGER
jgi:UDP-glucose 4-epimerase